MYEGQTGERIASSLARAEYVFASLAQMGGKTIHSIVLPRVQFGLMVCNLNGCRACSYRHLQGKYSVAAGILEEINSYPGDVEYVDGALTVVS